LVKISLNKKPERSREPEKLTAFLFLRYEMKLEDCRKVIDAIDAEILMLLNRRAHISRRIGRMKTYAGLPIVDQGREEIVMRRLLRDNPGEIGDRAVAGIYQQILEESRRIQRNVAGEMDAIREKCK